MLNQSGFSLLEALISITLSTIMVLGISSFYTQLQTNIYYNYQKKHLQTIVEQGLVGISKDIRRAGFIANDPTKMTAKPIDITSNPYCITLRYDSEIRNDWIYNPNFTRYSDIFSYRFNQKNIEYKTGELNCRSSQWEKLFDPAEVKITQFSIKQQQNGLEITLAAELKQNKKINYQITKFIKNENPLSP